MTRLHRLWTGLADAARLMVGQSSYRVYCEHMATHHPDAEVMDERSFFRHREAARYGGRNGGRCC
ncbi:YbdD/YjiX family protein [Sphingomonas sp. Root710]|uniref:YbdD/YjiX family protein n=1 Tax=Sphingomonas sp. Root710 TaxID=1736594 RepID=UPI0009E9FAAD|nr:CstA-like transporter-associated (seleno)protein [Sphingomonas sp. Root710]